jgi:hypothetical protein
MESLHPDDESMMYIVHTILPADKSRSRSAHLMQRCSSAIGFQLRPSQSLAGLLSAAVTPQPQKLADITSWQELTRAQLVVVLCWPGPTLT